MKNEQYLINYQKLKIQIDTLNISDREKDELKWEAIENFEEVKSNVRERKLNNIL